MPTMEDRRPAIVIPCYDRPESLKRLLSTILAGEHSHATDLVISIDKSAQQSAVEAVAQACEWPYGELKIICHERNLGLKAHILKCGDLTQVYNYVVLLEDDLLVAPGFMQFAQAAVNAYQDDERVAGISLYAYDRKESDTRPFSPVRQGYDTYFMQFASSWGQVWTTEQWRAFRNWLADNDCAHFDDISAKYVAKWPATSWKKHFIRYLEHENRYFVFPYSAFSTNPGEDGTHHNYIFGLFASELELGIRPWRFAPLNKTGICYNSCFELINTEALPKVYFYLHNKQPNGDDAKAPAQTFFSRHPYRSPFYLSLFFRALKVDGAKVIHKLHKLRKNFKRG